jgi:hypothetical protein
MSDSGIEYLGWAATAVFVGSYFCLRPSLLRGFQMFGAALWVLYGVLINASPVVIANVLVFSAAAWTMFRTAAGKRAEHEREPCGPTSSARTD